MANVTKIVIYLNQFLLNYLNFYQLIGHLYIFLGHRWAFFCDL